MYFPAGWVIHLHRIIRNNYVKCGKCLYSQWVRQKSFEAIGFTLMLYLNCRAWEQSPAPGPSCPIYLYADSMSEWEIGMHFFLLSSSLSLSCCHLHWKKSLIYRLPGPWIPICEVRIAPHYQAITLNEFSKDLNLMRVLDKQWLLLISSTS